MTAPFQDGAGRLQPEQALAELTATLDLAAVLVRAPDGTILHWSRGCERLYGWSAQDAVGRQVHELLHTVFPVPPSEIDALLARDGEWTGELHQTTRDGRVIVVAARKALRRDAQGRAAAVAESATDVTAARHAEQQLRASEARSRAMFEATAVGMVRASFQGERLLEANAAFCRMLGRTRDEILATPWTALTHPDDVGPDLDGFRRMGRGEIETYGVEKRFIHADGHPVWTRLTLSLVRDAHGRPDYEIAVVEDISARRAAEAALRESEAQLRLALDAGHMGVFDWDLATDRLEWDARQYALFEADPADGPMTGQRAGALVHPEDLAALRAAIAAAVESGQGPFRYEFRVPLRSGAVRWIAGHGLVTPGPDGRAARMVGLNFETTQSREAAAALARSNEAARLAAERVQLALDAGAIIGTWVWELPTDAFTVDERFAESFGIDPALGRTGLTLEQVVATVHPEDLPGLRAAIEVAIARGGPYRHEYRVRGLDGVYRWIEANGRVELGADGTPLRFPGVLLDIGQRRALEAERDRAVVLLRAFADAVPGVVYAKDREGRMLIANRGTTELIGKPPQAYLGKTDLEFLEDKVQAAAVMANDRRIMDRGVPEQLEEVVSRPDGTPSHWLSTKAPFRDAEGRVIGLIGASVDITARKAAETVLARDKAGLETLVAARTRDLQETQARLAQAQRMEALGRLAGGIAHDFNNVLQAVQSASLIIERRPTDVELVLRVARMALDAVARGSTITQRLLAFARRDVLQAEPVEAALLLDGLREMLAHTLGSHIEVQVVVEPGLPPLLADRGQLETVLVNLATNARDAMSGGGRLTLRAVLEQVAAQAAPSAGSAWSLSTAPLAPGFYVRLEVGDNGSGMDEATLARVSEPFFTTKPTGRGTGLGLSMARGFAEQSSGALAIRSAPERGTTVLLWLPTEAAEPLPAAAGAAAAAQQAGLAGPGAAADARAGDAGRRVLLVDDEAAVRETLGMQLSDEGFTVHAEPSAAAALAWLDSGGQADVLVTDLSMPGMNGLALIEEAQARRVGLPALLLTGFPGEVAQLRAQAADAAGQPRFALMQKPASAAAIARQIESLG